MIRILFAVDAAILALLGLASLVTSAPFGSVAVTFLAAELGVAVVVALRMIPRTLRKVHPPREVAQPVERVTAEVIEPAMPPARRVRVLPAAQIEAPLRELEVRR